MRRRRIGFVAALLLLSALFGPGCGGKSPPQQVPQLGAMEHARAAQSYLAAGRTTAAIAEMEQALELEPANPRVHHAHGTLLFQIGQLEPAEAAFKKTLQLDAWFTEAHHFLGAVYTEMERYTEAEQEYGLALEDRAYPTPELVYMNLGLLYGRQGRDEEALGNLRKSVEINRDYYRAHYELATVLDRMGNLREAAQEYEQAEPDFKNRGKYWYQRGLVYFKLSRKQEAADSFRRCVDVSPGSESAALCDELLQVLEARSKSRQPTLRPGL